MRRLVSIALLVAVAGCTAAKASLQIVNAEQSLTRAETEGASEIATYEFTMARLYLEKAQEEAGYSEFRIADALARQSAEWSDRAVIFVEKRGRTSINLDDFELPEKAAPAPESAPAPTPAPDEDWLQESNPDRIPGGGPNEDAEEPPPPEEEPEEEPDPFEIEETEDEIDIGGTKPKPKPAPGDIDDTGVPK